MTDNSDLATIRAAIIDASRFHVAFDGWSDAVLKAAAAEADIPLADARAAFPRGAIDLAYEFHVAGDRALAEALAEGFPADLRYSQKVAYAVRKRLEIAASDREAVRRGVAFFALPMNAATGTRAIWHTADTIWTALGDTSKDINWYSKRAILSGVYSASVLYWLGDRSEGFEDSWAFIDRRISDVMRFEKAKAAARKSPLHRAFMAGPGRLFDHIRAPNAEPPSDLPGHLKA